MLSIKQNFLETIHGGKPDRFVNQYEYLTIPMGTDPISRHYPIPMGPGQTVKNGWGVTYTWKEGQIGAFPEHGDKIVCKDVTKWKETVHAPNLIFPDEQWADAKAAFDAIDRSQVYASAAYFTGVFEMLHFLMGIDECLPMFYEEPEAMHELIDYVTEYELTYAKEWTRHCHPNCLFHHDDWGTQNSSFMSPEMFGEFIVPAYKKIYKFWRDNGVEIIIHHNDSWSANLVPQMIEMGIDVWQGCIKQNDLPKLAKEFGGKISFMGGINNGLLDKPDWTPAEVEAEVTAECKKFYEATHGHYIIPCMVHGLSFSCFPGVYEECTKVIDKMNHELFK
jgi:hypothetical protein